MKTLRILAAACAALVFCSSAALAADDGWLDNYATAAAQAKATKKLLLMEFTGSDWCPPCKKQAAEVFSTQEFKDYAAKHFVLLKLDFPRTKVLPEDVKLQNRELNSKFGIRGYPTIIVLDPEGQEKGRLVGYGGGGAAAVIAKLDAFTK